MYKNLFKEKILTIYMNFKLLFSTNYSKILYGNGKANEKIVMKLSRNL